jgi:hypothetical protein
MQPEPISEILISAALFGVIMHAYLSGRYVAQRESTTNWMVATLVIFFSGMWFIGPFAYFGFRKKQPILARACLRQMVALMALWLFFVLVDSFSRNW